MLQPPPTPAEATRAVLSRCHIIVTLLSAAALLLRASQRWLTALPIHRDRPPKRDHSGSREGCECVSCVTRADTNEKRTLRRCRLPSFAKSRRRRVALGESVYDESPIVVAGERCDDGTRWTTMGRILTLRSESAGQPIANACALGFRTKTWLKIHNAEIADR